MSNDELNSARAEFRDRMWGLGPTDEVEVEAIADFEAAIKRALRAEIESYVEEKTRAFGPGFTYEHNCDMGDDCSIIPVVNRVEAEWRAMHNTVSTAGVADD